VQNLFQITNTFSQDTDIIAQLISSSNTSGERRVFASSSKQGGVSKITRKNWKISNIQKGGKEFKPKTTEMKR
jgi:hypothetical protein